MDIALATEVFETFWNHFLDFLGILRCKLRLIAHDSPGNQIELAI